MGGSENNLYVSLSVFLPHSIYHQTCPCSDSLSYEDAQQPLCDVRVAGGGGSLIGYCIQALHENTDF